MHLAPGILFIHVQESQVRILKHIIYLQEQAKEKIVEENFPLADYVNAMYLLTG